MITFRAQVWGESNLAAPSCIFLISTDFMVEMIHIPDHLELCPRFLFLCLEIPLVSLPWSRCGHVVCPPVHVEAALILSW